jgi:hypothetical protein
MTLQFPRPLLSSAASFALFAALLSGQAQSKLDTRPAPLNPVEAAREARELVGELLAQKPDQNQTNLGRLIIQTSRSSQREIPVRFDTVRTSTNWLSIYETQPSAGETNSTKLVVIHTAGQPNQYLLTESAHQGPANSAPRRLAGNDTMIPFADSDFWIADLGFEFLSWPKQTLLKKEMRNNKFCEVLESVNPSPGAAGYARVVSWLTADEPHGPAHADAYDATGKKIKVFDPKSIEKVEGVYQLHSVEMRNLKTRSRTVMEFNSGAD